MKALERGENPNGLRAAYEQAVQRAQEKFGQSKSAPTQQQGADKTGVNPASKEVTEQLENALLNSLFEGVDLGSASKEEQENMREKSREYIRETEGYKKLILSGDGNISEVLDDPEKMARLLTSVANEVVEKLEQNEQTRKNEEPQKNNEKEMNRGENIPTMQ